MARSSNTRHEVIHGYKQTYGVDFYETFATVVKAKSYKTILAMCAIYGCEVRHIDVVTAFLNGMLKETVYMEMPHGFKLNG